MLYDLYRHAADTRSDINEHVPVLAEYASRCGSVLELGVCSCVSSWALLAGLSRNGREEKRLRACDVRRHANVAAVERVAAEYGIRYTFHECDDLLLEPEPVDLTFIDTWHVYGQLKRELARFAPLTARYIVMHDTATDAEVGESVRCELDVAAQALRSGMPESEIRRGLRPAIAEFLAANPEWAVELELPHNNGLTVLRRIVAPPPPRA